MRSGLPSWPRAGIPYIMENDMAKGTFKIGRNAGTGRFTTVKTATEKKSTHVVETIKK